MRPICERQKTFCDLELSERELWICGLEETQTSVSEQRVLEARRGRIERQIRAADASIPTIRSPICSLETIRSRTCQ